jgi:hypothetical protein
LSAAHTISSSKVAASGGQPGRATHCWITKAFDRALADQYGRDCRIEDCWRPFAAVATNLSTHNLELIRSGRLWQAVRASSAIPGLLPPFYTPEGAMLVDGCLIDNVPLAPMHQLKSGPNLVVHFGEPAAEMFDVAYDALPGRIELFAAMLMPFRKKLLPTAPSAVNVLWRSPVAHQRYDTLPTAPLDIVMRPPLSARDRCDRFRSPYGDFSRVLPLGSTGHRCAGDRRQRGNRRHPRRRQAGNKTTSPSRRARRQRSIQLSYGCVDAPFSRLAWHRQRPCGGLVGGGARLQRHGSNVRIVSDAPGWACAGRAWIVAAQFPEGSRGRWFIARWSSRAGRANQPCC